MVHSPLSILSDNVLVLLLAALAKRLSLLHQDKKNTKTGHCDECYRDETIFIAQVGNPWRYSEYKC
jgi:hypothetical protein